jgi:hypothetical protein
VTADLGLQLRLRGELHMNTPLMRRSCVVCQASISHASLRTLNLLLCSNKGLLDFSDKHTSISYNGREKEATSYAHQGRTGIEKPKGRAKGRYGDETEEKGEESKAEAQPYSA